MTVIEHDAQVERMWRASLGTFPRGPIGNNEQVQLFNKRIGCKDWKEA